MRVPRASQSTQANANIPNPVNEKCGNVGPSWAQWHASVSSAFVRVKQNDYCEFGVSLGFIVISRPICAKK